MEQVKRRQLIRKYIVRAGLFFASFLICFLFIVRTLRFKNTDGVYMMKTFYEQEPDTVDLLILGTSHAFENINPGVLWEEQGVASYILGGPNQRLWNTYYSLKEALKTQKPKLVLLEGYAVCFEGDYVTDGQIVSNTFGMQWSRNKKEAMEITIPKKRMGEFAPEYIRYHSRYTDLSSEDFLKDKGDPYYENWKGFFCNFNTMYYDTQDVSQISDRRELNEKNRVFYEKILQLCSDEQIPILIVISPYPNASPEDMMAFNTAEELAERYGAAFLNCVREPDRFPIDYSVESADAEHLNYKGNQRFTKQLSVYLSENYSLPDRRGEAGYYSWQKNAECLNAMIKNQELKEKVDKEKVLEGIGNSDYWIFASTDGDCSTADPNIAEYLEMLGIEEKGESGIWLRTDSDNEAVLVGTDAYSKYYRYDKTDFKASRSLEKDGLYRCELMADGMIYHPIANGLTLLFYDTVTESIAGCVGIDGDQGYRIVNWYDYAPEE